MDAFGVLGVDDIDFGVIIIIDFVETFGVEIGVLGNVDVVGIVARR